MASSQNPQNPPDPWTAINQLTARRPSQDAQAEDSARSVSNISLESDSEDDEWWLDLDWNWSDVENQVSLRMSWAENLDHVPDFNQGGGRNRRPKPPPPMRPPPKKSKIGGQFSYVEYIPAWTDPDYDPNIEFFGDKSDGTRKFFERFTKDFMTRLRPAQLPADTLRNPTLMAQRYGIYPKRTDGRSRLSPTQSKTRRVNLAWPITLADGSRKEFVDFDDYKAIHEKHYMADENKAGREGGQSFGDYLLAKSKQPTTTTQQEADDAMTFEALWRLHQMIEADQGYQRVLFRDYTTDELIQQGVFKFEDNVECDLNGPLHPFLQRHKWMGTEYRGGDIDEPRLLWAFGDQRGEWTAHDDRVWDCMQPALQVVTRLLSMNAPALMGLMDIYSQMPLEQFRYSKTTGSKIYLSQRAMWSTRRQLDRAFPSLRKLYDTGFNAQEWVHRLLHERLMFSLGSAYRGGTGRRYEAGNDWNGTHYAWTTLLEIESLRKVGVLARDWSVRIDIATEVIWPLMSSQYTAAEKLTCSFGLAVTIFHELCHAIEMINGVMRTYPFDFSIAKNSHEQRVSNEIMLALLAVGQEMPCKKLEPFFEGHSVAETGFAVEKEVFGGKVESLVDVNDAPTPAAVHLICTALSLEDFPPAIQDNPSTAIRFGTSQFTVPLPAINDVRVALPYEGFAKFFKKAFWATQVPRFGTEAVKLHVDGKAIKGALATKTWCVDDLQYVFGKKRGLWMATATSKLGQFGYSTIAAYLEHLCRSHTTARITRRNWYHDSTQWPVHKAKIGQALESLRQVAGDFLMTFHRLTEGGEAWEKMVREQIEGYRQTRGGTIEFNQASVQLRRNLQWRNGVKFDNLVALLMGLSRTLTERVRYAQLMVRTYLQLSPDDRAELYNSYGKILRRHLQHTVSWTCEKIMTCVVRMAQYMQPRIPNKKMPVEINTRFKWAFTRFQALRSLVMHTLSYMDPANVGMHLGGAGAKLVLVVSASLDHAVRAEGLRELAVADMALIDDPDVRQIVDTFDTIFQVHMGRQIMPEQNVNMDRVIDEMLKKLKPDNDDKKKGKASKTGAGSVAPATRPDRGAHNMFNFLGVKKGSSRVTKPTQKTQTTDEKKQKIAQHALKQMPLRTAVSTQHQPPNPNMAPTAALGTAPTQAPSAAPTQASSTAAAVPFTQYATAAHGFPTSVPGQPPAFVATAPLVAPPPPLLEGASMRSQFHIFRAPFADARTIDMDVTEADLDWATPPPPTLATFHGTITNMLQPPAAEAQDDAERAAAVLLAIAGLSSTRAAGAGTTTNQGQDQPSHAVDVCLRSVHMAQSDVEFEDAVAGGLGVPTELWQNEGALAEVVQYTTLKLWDGGA